jgi:hypothetical protein
MNAPAMYKAATYTVLVIGGLPIAGYPFVLLASVMSLAGEHRGPIRPWLLLVAIIAQLSALVYPWVYFRSAKRAQAFASAGDDWRACVVGLRPLGYLLVVAGLFWVWTLCEP